MGLPHSQASERNKVPIAQVLEQVFPARGAVLEIGSGSGQHAVYFGPRFPELDWQPTETPEHIEGLAARVSLQGSENVLPPLVLDVLGPWPEGGFEAAFSANTSHIMSWEAVCAMFEGLGRVLLDGGLFCLYGPFNRDGAFTAASNEQFDASLRARDPRMGLRDLEALESLARRHQMEWLMEFEMPANNLLLLFRKGRT
jgi:hypothetical protein